MTTDQRIEKLEKGLASARRLNRWLLAAVGVAFGVWILAGTLGPTMAAAPGSGGAVKEVRAREFILEDEKGNNRARLSMGNDGPALALFDERGINRAQLTACKGGSMLCLSDEKGEPRAITVVNKEGPGLNLLDENRKPRIGLTVPKEGPGMTLNDEKGESRATVGVTQTTSRDGKTTTYPESSMLLFGADGKVIWQAR
jgi:hypothetical protein